MNKLKYFRKTKGIDQNGIAEIFGITQSTYSRYENGKRDIPTDMLTKFADYFGVTVDQILGLDDPAPEPIGRPIQIEYQPVPEAEVMIPVVASLRCGFGSPGEPFTIIGKKPVPASMVERWGKEIVLIEAAGDSMAPTILPGDFTVCYPSDWWEDGMIVVINVNDSDTVKRIYRTSDGGIDLVPDNPDYKSMHYTPRDIEDYQIKVLAHVLTKLPQPFHPIPRRKEN